MSKPARIEHMDDHTGYLLVKLGSVAGAAFERALLPSGMHARHVRVLGFIHDAALSQQDLCALTGLDRTTMVAVVDELEQRGYARRERSQVDRRKHVVRLTKSGASAYQTATKRLLATQDELLAPLAAKERAELRRLLNRLFVSYTDDRHC
jgi:DNA-binding MarR family transcriptional regulator